MEEGDIIHVDYDLYNGETGDLIETTREATAQEHEMHDENRTCLLYTSDAADE